MFIILGDDLVTRRKERRGGRSNEKEGAMRKKKQQRGRSDDEEGATKRKEQRGRGSAKEKGAFSIHLSMKKMKKSKKMKLIKDASLTARSCSPSSPPTSRHLLYRTICGVSSTF